MEEKDREIWIGKNRIYLDEDNILYYTGFGEHDEKTAIEIMKASLRLVNMVEGKVNVILDHNNSGKSCPAARKIYKGMTEHEKFGKIAHWGVHPVARVLASFVMGTSRKKEMRFFKTKEEALTWLKE